MPSVLRKRSRRETNAVPPKFWHKDIVCLPPSYYHSSCIAIPRGRNTALLASSNLIGKVRLDSSMDEEEIRRKICSVFEGPMRKDPAFPFSFLQNTGGGTNSLSIVNVSSN